LSDLEGDWRVERLGGLLPPMVGVWKRIHGDHGETRLGPLPGVPFKLEQREGGIALIYCRPFAMFIDTLRREPDGSWVGQATVNGLAFGHFRMTRK
jgi:hypothetical protein